MRNLVDAGAIDQALALLFRRWVKRKHVEHFNARTVEDAISLLHEYKEGAKIIAGGVDLISLMKNRVTAPDALVNIKTIPDFAYIVEDAEGLKIGTLATINDLAQSVIIRDNYRMLAEAAQSVSAPQLRNMATIGGNLCQEVRCWYYRRSPATGRTFFCFRKGGENCYAVAGNNSYHAIFSDGECHAVCPSDLAPALIALDAKIKIAGPVGERAVPLAHFYTPLGNILEPDDLITEIQIPIPRPNTKQRFLKFRLRKAIDFAISSVSATVTTDSGIITDARIVLGGVAPTPYRALGAEEALRGKPLGENTAEVSADAALNAAVPLDKNTYKVPITHALVKRAIIL